MTKARRTKRAAFDDDDNELSETEDFTTVGKGGKAMQFTSEGIFKNLQLVQEARGKKVRFKNFRKRYMAYKVK